MVRRTKDWNEGLAEDLKDPVFAAEFIIGALEEGATIQEALSKVIRLHGVKEFAEKVDMASSNVLRALDARYNPTQATLNRLLEPFGLRISVQPTFQKAA
jgi:DNA-binding phage protein